MSVKNAPQVIPNFPKSLFHFFTAGIKDDLVLILNEFIGAVAELIETQFLSSKI